jgi:hypothetical protein
MAATVTNVLALPVVAVQIQTSNNEDWVDTIKYVIDDGTSGDVNQMPQLDLRGIRFSMEIRRTADDAEVIFGASTDNGTLLIGNPPDYGFLIIQVPLVEMQNHAAGDYVGDIVGSDEHNSRVAVQIDLTIIEGVTKQPVNKRIAVTYP